MDKLLALGNLDGSILHSDQGVLSYEETKKLIDDFIEYYNNERIQQNLGWKTPNEVVA